jgi:hypothetical protein
MKRFAVAAVIVMLLAGTAGRAAAVPDDYDDTQSHPLRIAAYLLYPVGYTAEWLIFRPFHYLVSRPTLEPFFGHRQHEEIGGYR